MANPLATILSGAMMFRYSLAAPPAADAIERAVDAVLAAGFRTRDIGDGRPGQRLVGTREMGDEVLRAIEGEAQ